jgi:di/tripeptidase
MKSEPMSFWGKLKQRLRLGFTVTEPLSERGKMILDEDWDAGYKVIDAVLKAQREKKEHGMIAEDIRLGKDDYDLIQA